ncbi:MAG: methionyl-tRNA formyltransferase [Minisyncoccia bacterium]
MVIFCVHPSLLPAYRGPAPIETALLNNEYVTGVSIMMLDPLVDHGPIVAVKDYVVGPTDTRIDLTENLFTLGGAMCSDVMPKYLNNEIKSIDQDHSKATFTKKIKKEDGLIEFTDVQNTTDPLVSQTLWNKYRAYKGMMGVYFFLSSPLPNVGGGRVGVLFANNNSPLRIKITEAVFTDGVFEIKKVIPEGKKEMTFEDFKRGHSI